MSVPVILLVSIRPLVAIVIGPLKVKPLESLAAFPNFIPNVIDTGFATTRSPPMGSSVLFVALSARRVPNPNGPDGSPV